MSRTISWIHGPMFVASAIVTYGRQGRQKQQFLQCMETFRSLIKSHVVVETFVRALFSLAVAAKILTIQDATIHHDSICQGRRTLRNVRDVETTVVIDQHLAMEDRAGAVGDHLARKYDEMVMFNQYVDIDQHDETIHEKKTDSSSDA